MTKPVAPGPATTAAPPARPGSATDALASTESRIWVTIEATQPRQSQIIRVQVPFEWLRSSESILGPALQSEITRKHINLEILAQALRARPLGEKLEALTLNEVDAEVRVGLEHRAPPTTSNPATQLQLQVREDRDDGAHMDMTLPLPLAQTLIAILSDYEHQGEKVLPEIQQVVNLDKVIDNMGRHEPFDLVLLEEPGYRIMLRGR